MGVGGAERQLVHLSAALVGRDIDVHVATVRNGDYDAALGATGATVHRIAASPVRYDPRVPLRLSALARRLRPDVMNSWLMQMDLAAAVAAPLASVPRVLSERSSAGAYPPSMLNRARVWSGKRADAIIANSEGGRAYWGQHVDHRRIHVVPNIVPRIDATPSVHERIAAGDDVILFVGRFSEEKNLPLLLEALALVLAGASAMAVFCGDGPLRPAVEEKARSLGIADRCLFLGTVSNVWSWMKRAAVLAAVSTFEGDPNAVLEAIACGTPVVVSDIPAHRALLGESSAFFADAASAASIAAGLTAALRDRDDARRRAEKASAVIASRSANEIAAQYEEIYRNL